MRNLRNIQRSTVHFVDGELPLAATTWDTTNDSLICAFGPTETNVLIELRRVKHHPRKDEKHQLIASWDAPCPHPDLLCDSILNLHYFADTAITCLILAGGDIVIVREEPLPGEDLLEIVGSVDAGITAAAWSPDEELLTICTKAHTLLFMSRDFEIIADISLAPEDVKASNHVSVGWGKVETQFKGKRSKVLRDPTMPEKVDDGFLSKHDDARSRISWRGDGAYVAVNSVEGGKRRMIRIYSREGTLDNVSEPVDNLEGPLSWRPTGNIIAGVRRLDNSTDVVFFERNGLRHGDFNLRLTKTELDDWGTITDLFWNVDSTVLAVCFLDRIQLWTMGNYHYYLKQEVRLSAHSPIFKSMCWHPEKSLRFAGHGTDQVIFSDFAFFVAKGPTAPPNDSGTVVVIDGSLLKLTPLRNANVPPPMALHELQLEHPTIDVAIDQFGTQLAVLDASALNVYTYNITTKSSNHPVLKRSYPLSEPHATPVQVAWRGIDKVLVLAHDFESNRDDILELQITTGEWTLLVLGIDHIATISSDQGYQEVCVQSTEGFVAQALPNPASSPIFLGRLCPWIEMINLEDEPTVFGLSETGNLYANDQLLVSNCTSFLVTPAHLIFTTTQHLLKFVHLTSLETLEIPPNEPETDERCRSIERGARLVTVIPTTYSLVLQMPRGNLETIYPRALVLAGIRKSIGAKKYQKAFLACRNQRVDMNILHDHAPKQFMENVGLFVDQINKVEHIDLFLSQLREEDVSKTMYRETILTPSHPTVIRSTATRAESSTTVSNPSLIPESKINRICDAFLETLRKRSSSNLQNIVTANVCKSPPDLEGGLSVIATLREQDEEVAEKTAEHICFLADVNQLYDTALGMYNLDLTLLIAQQSQKDPREYLPYLQSLQEMEPLRRQFTIDNDLGRHQKAIAHLHALDAFEEVKRYAVKYELYSAAINLYKYQEERLKALTKLHADYLTQFNKFKEAGIAYESLEDYDSAISAYRQANLWRQALYCADAIEIPQAELTSLAQDLAEGLTESKQHQDAATVYLEYLNEVEEAAQSLCKCYKFADAIRIIHRQRKRELLETVVDPGLIDGFNSTTELLADCKSQIQAQLPRLRELRLKKEQDPLAFYAGDATAAEGTDFPDNVSLAPTDASTSGGTFLTRYTGHTNGTLNTQTTRRTSKNRRREERKRARGKKGSVYEEEYLVSSIGRLIERINNIGEEVGRLVEGLMVRGMRERAVVVENSMAEVVEMCSGIVDEVYQSKVPEKEVEERPMGADGVLWDALEGVGVGLKPVVKAFERLALLS